MIKETLKPLQHQKVIDLVEQAGIDVSDWANFKGGKSRASTNPKYCYEWSFVSHDKEIIVLNIWYDRAFDKDGVVIQNLNLRKTSENSSGARRQRAVRMDQAIQLAYSEKREVRAIICDGSRSLTGGSVDTRMLDSQPWHIEKYNFSNGDCTLGRGPIQYNYIDQFDNDDGQPTKSERATTNYNRSSSVRDAVRKRARGHCEWCGARGFITKAGSLYLETHHIEPLSEGGMDSVKNVIALCPNHHREAHYGINDLYLRNQMLGLIQKALTTTQTRAL